MKFCPRCGQRLTGFDLEEKQRYVHHPEAPLKGKSWFERHLNWTMVLAWVGAYVVNFIIGFMIALSNPYISYGELFGIGLIIASAILAPVWGWTLRKKNRSLWWLPLGLFVPFGFVVLMCLENKSLNHDASDNSIANYNKAIELNSSNPAIYYKRGDAYDELGEYGKAIADYSKAIQLNPNYINAYYNRGCAYGEIGKYEEAIADYNKVIELRPNDALAYYNRSLAYHEKGEVTKAVSDLEKCIGLSTDPELTKDAQQALLEIKNSP